MKIRNHPSLYVTGSGRGGGAGVGAGWWIRSIRGSSSSGSTCSSRSGSSATGGSNSGSIRSSHPQQLLLEHDPAGGIIVRTYAHRRPRHGACGVRPWRGAMALGLACAVGAQPAVSTPTAEKIRGFAHHMFTPRVLHPPLPAPEKTRGELFLGRGVLAAPDDARCLPLPFGPEPPRLLDFNLLLCGCRAASRNNGEKGIVQSGVTWHRGCCWL